MSGQRKSWRVSLGKVIQIMRMKGRKEMKETNTSNDELIIKNALNGVNTPEYNIISEIEKSRATKKSPSFKRHMVTAAASIFLMIFTVSAAAATISGFKYLLSIIGEENTAVITPVEISDEDQGIKVEVVAAGRFDNILRVYVTLQDMTGERLGDDVRIDDYSITGIERSKSDGSAGISTSGGFGRIDYDKENHKATLLYERNSDTKLEGEELTLKINRILYNTKKYEEYKVMIADLSKIDRNPQILYPKMNQFLFAYNIGVPGGSFQDYKDEDTVPVLKEQENKINFPQTESLKICAMGIIDGKLHVQIWNDINSPKNIDYNVFLKDPGNPDQSKLYINSEGTFGFDLDENGNITKETDFPTYTEYVYGIDEDRLEQYVLLAYISESDVINGNWEVEFNSKDSGEILKTECSLAMDGATVEYAAINPFGGIRIEGTIDDPAKIPVMFNVKINMSDGEIISPSMSPHGYSATSSYGYSESSMDGQEIKFEVFYETGELVDLNSVVSLEVNGRIISFDK